MKLCGKSIIRNIDYARKNDYQIELHYVGVESVEIAKERIAYRVAHGGHGIPDKDVERRYKESLDNLKKIIHKCNWVILYDNTKAFKRFAVYENGKLRSLSENLPEWYKKWLLP